MIYLLILIITLYLTCDDIKRYTKVNQHTAKEKLMFSIALPALIYIFIIFLNNCLTLN